MIFGDAKIEDMNQAAQAAAAERFRAPESAAAAAPAATAAVEDDEEVDATGIEESDIALVLQQAEGCTRAQAIKALRNNGGEAVDAIMELTM